MPNVWSDFMEFILNVTPSILLQTLSFSDIDNIDVAVMQTSEVRVTAPSEALQFSVVILKIHNCYSCHILWSEITC
jgi:hypothetical protein